MQKMLFQAEEAILHTPWYSKILFHNIFNALKLSTEQLASPKNYNP